MNAVALCRIDEWVYRFRHELERKAAKLDDPGDAEIDRVARWACDVQTWWPEDTDKEGEIR